MMNFEKVRIASLVVTLLLSSGILVSGQVCGDYFPIKEGTSLSYANYDKKDKLTGGSEMSLKEKTSTPKGMDFVFAAKSKDDKGEVLYDSELHMECVDGVLYFDASTLLDPATMSAYESMEVKVSGDNLELPLNAENGTSLKNGSVTAVISSGGVKIMTLSVEVSNRQIVARETVETPAGSFECVKYTYDALSQMGFVKMSFSGVEWYSHRYGTIRSESYDKKGKLTGYTVLESASD